jgi:aryl-alcohol dehydrogenase-like predicted oxidoreductase
MEYRELGESGIEVSAVTLGLWNVADPDTWGRTAEDEVVEAVEAAVDSGITTFDTAEAYGDGRSEELLGRAIEGYDREDLVLATKAHPDNHAPADLRAACEASLDRLGTDYVDVYYLHWPSRETPLGETVRALRELREDGLVRLPAVSNFGPRDLDAVADGMDVHVNQVPYSLLWRAVEADVLPACRRHDTAVAAYSPLAQGLLTGAYAGPGDVPPARRWTRHFSGEHGAARHGESGAERETFEAVNRVRDIAESTGRPMPEVALAWVLARREVATAVVGTTDPEHVRANARAAERPLDPAVRDDLTDATEELREALGSNPDMWQSDSRYR